MIVPHVVLSFIHFIYLVVTFLLSLYSLNVLLLTLLFWWRRLRGKPNGFAALALPENLVWPVVTVQLPCYNEKEIALRIIDQVVQLDYDPRRLHIQVLDDSTDETAQMVAERVAHYQAQGVWITLLHRTHRLEYKAGALREGIEQSPAEFFAVFDADFMPAPDWLKKAISPFLVPGSQRLGFVQTRWAHLNDRFSLITRAQALALDGHFGIEQTVCSDYGLLVYLNGTGFVMRRECIIDAGNWSGETLVEDLDLSFRAQLRGWKGLFLRDVSAPAELPGLFAAFKKQQFRWSKGSIQVLRRLGWKVMTAKLPLLTRFEGLIHMAGYSMQSLMLLLIILALPLYLWSNAWLVKLPLNSLGIIGIGVPVSYISAYLTLYPSQKWLDLLVRLPAISLLGVGIAANNTLGVLDGLRGRKSVFERTPKLGTLQGERIDRFKVKTPIKISNAIWLELLIAVYALISTLTTLRADNFIGAYFFSIYILGFGWAAAAELFENWVAHRNAQD
jgi:cellulose synthase/poly-beta-1,6-N-acetylglucosamine synthase-like glycosyltransferase